MQPKLRSDAHELIVAFIREKVSSSGASGVVIGVSGGIDSALTLRLCVDALGPAAVHATILPDGEWNGKDEQDAISFATELGVDIHKFSIKDAVAVFASLLRTDDKKVLGNMKARSRMVLNYSIANINGLLVVGTSNKSEFLTGYYTKYGDGASDICPIGDLYKTEVRQLAARISLPKEFLEKAPSAGLWSGQTDEGEMGVTYDDLDVILLALERGTAPADIASVTRLPGETVEKVLQMVASSKHKRSLPLIPRIGTRTIGVNWNV